jgi:hypothetical protein
MGGKRKQGNMTPQKTDNNIIEDLVKSERDESPVTYFRRTMIRMFNELKEELKENMQIQLNEYHMNMDKKQLSELK